MILNPFVFLIGRTIAKNSGVSDAQATTDGFAASIIKPPVLGLVLVSALAKGQASTASGGAPAPGAAPVIKQILPASGTAGDAVTITGANFGAYQGISVVTFNGTQVLVKAWSDTSIEVEVPSYLPAAIRKSASTSISVSVQVWVNAVGSNPMPFTIT